ncbi:MAG: mycofactocin system FadH/OYE family oxidoreductase 2, partial [Pseudomonadota bacterium]
MTYQRLLTPIDLGPVRLRNRIAFPAHRTNLAGKGRISEALQAYYRERAQGGCGLVVVGEFSIHPNDRPYEKLIHLFGDVDRSGISRLAASIREHGARVFGRLTHRGFQSQGVISRLPLWGPEPIGDIVHGEVCKAMEPEDIHELVAAFAQGARCLVEAGFDGIEIDVGETGILRQFLSPLTNHRTDEYGGDLPGRLRLTTE